MRVAIARHFDFTSIAASPARALGMQDTGSIEVGKFSDLLWVKHRHGHPDLLRTWVGGREVYASA